MSVLAASGEQALNEIRDQAAALSSTLGAEKALEELEVLRNIIGSLLGTHSKGELRIREGLAVAAGTPVDAERMARFELLASHLRIESLPRIETTIGSVATQHFAFIESYFSNYVEGVKFDMSKLATS